MAWLRAEDDVFLLGSDLLIAPQFDADPIREPVLPRRAWHELTLFDRDERGARNSDLPRLYQRGDSIVPLGPRVQFVDQTSLDTLTLMVCPR